MWLFYVCFRPKLMNKVREETNYALCNFITYFISLFAKNCRGVGGNCSTQSKSIVVANLKET